jgi:hypothetical protein
MNMSMYLIHDHLHLCRISSSSMKQTMFQCQIRIYPLENVVLVLLPKMNYIGHNAQIMHRSNKCIYSYPLCAFFFLFFLWIEFLSGAQAFFTVRFRFSFAFDNFKSFHLLEWTSQSSYNTVCVQRQQHLFIHSFIRSFVRSQPTCSIFFLASCNDVLSLISVDDIHPLICSRSRWSFLMSFFNSCSYLSFWFWFGAE